MYSDFFFFFSRNTVMMFYKNEVQYDVTVSFQFSGDYGITNS